MAVDLARLRFQLISCSNVPSLLVPQVNSEREGVVAGEEEVSEDRKCRWALLGHAFRACRAIHVEDCVRDVVLTIPDSIAPKFQINICL